MQCSSNCNCEPDDGEFLTVDVLKNVPIETTPVEQDEETSVYNDSDSNDESSASTDTVDFILENNIDTLESCSTVYFAGYLAKKCLDMFSCSECTSSLIIREKNLNDKSQLLILYKTYDHIEQTQGLKSPSIHLINVTKICLNVFKNLFSKIRHGKKIIEKLKEKSMKEIYLKCPDSINSICKVHLNYIFDTLFRTKIFKQCKWENSKVRDKHYQNAAKLRVL